MATRSPKIAGSSSSPRTTRSTKWSRSTPSPDGYEATRELRRHEPPDHHTPVIAMTAGALPEDRRRCLDAGMDDHLTKPIDPDELQAALDRWTRAHGRP
jgi:CheY-like chemotaxis protein